MLHRLYSYIAYDDDILSIIVVMLLLGLVLRKLCIA